MDTPLFPISLVNIKTYHPFTAACTSSYTPPIFIGDCRLLRFQGDINMKLEGSCKICVPTADCFVKITLQISVLMVLWCHNAGMHFH